MMNPEDNCRYVVQISVQCVDETLPTDDEAIDYLSELNEKLESELMTDPCAITNVNPTALDKIDLTSQAAYRADESSTDDLVVADSSTQSFDLCPDCYNKYCRNPLSRERNLKLHFSNN